MGYRPWMPSDLMVLTYTSIMPLYCRVPVLVLASLANLKGSRNNCSQIGGDSLNIPETLREIPTKQKKIATTCVLIPSYRAFLFLRAKSRATACRIEKHVKFSIRQRSWTS